MVGFFEGGIPDLPHSLTVKGLAADCYLFFHYIFFVLGPLIRSLRVVLGLMIRWRNAKNSAETERNPFKTPLGREISPNIGFR